MEQAVSNIFSRQVLIACVLAGAVAFVVGLLVRVFKGFGAGRAILVALESLATTAVGGFLSYAFVSLLIGLGHDARAVAVAVGTLFLLWPLPLNILWGGSVTTLGLTSNPLLFGIDLLPRAAWVVGSLVGLFDGYRQIHKWWGWGVPSFVSDVTWGLATSANGLILHIVNLPRLFQVDASSARRAVHDDVPRIGHHRYSAGVALDPDFAFTQGSVISNLGSATTSAGLYEHEKTHVFQNRLFGPLYWVSYVFWIVVVGLIGGLISMVAPRRKLNNAVVLDNEFAFWWGYKDNPWEVWCYRHDPSGRMTVTPAQQAMGTIPAGWNDTLLSWPTPVVVVFALIAYALLAVWLVPWVLGSFA